MIPYLAVGSSGLLSCSHYLAAALAPKIPSEARLSRVQGAAEVDELFN